jgi:tRNA G46 methylase TrmB
MLKWQDPTCQKITTRISENMYDNFNILDVIKTSNIEDKSTWVNKAFFGLAELQDFLKAIPKGSRCLEIGCGSGILLSILSEKFPDHTFEGIEPFGDGFHGLETIAQLIKNQGINIEQIAYEDFLPKKNTISFSV